MSDSAYTYIYIFSFCLYKIQSGHRLLVSILENEPSADTCHHDTGTTVLDRPNDSTTGGSEINNYTYIV